MRMGGQEAPDAAAGKRMPVAGMAAYSPLSAAVSASKRQHTGVKHAARHPPKPEQLATGPAVSQTDANVPVADSHQPVADSRQLAGRNADSSRCQHPPDASNVHR